MGGVCLTLTLEELQCRNMETSHEWHIHLYLSFGCCCRNCAAVAIAFGKWSCQ